MKETIFSLMMSVICLVFWMWQIDDNTTNIAHERLKNAVNYAAHDASLQVDKSSLADGKLIFDSNKAQEVFGLTLGENLSLDQNLVPEEGTLFREKVTVIFTDYIDDADNVRYPFLYENSQFGIRHLLNGPAVIYAVEVPRPTVFNVNPGYNLVKWAVFEYPVPSGG